MANAVATNTKVAPPLEVVILIDDVSVDETIKSVLSPAVAPDAAKQVIVQVAPVPARNVMLCWVHASMDDAVGMATAHVDPRQPVVHVHCEEQSKNKSYNRIGENRIRRRACAVDTGTGADG